MFTIFFGNGIQISRARSASSAIRLDQPSSLIYVSPILKWAPFFILPLDPGSTSQIEAWRLIVEVCRQKESPKIHASAAHQNKYRHQRPAPDKSKVKGLEFDFEVDDFYCLGSPIGMYHYHFYTIFFEPRKTISSILRCSIFGVDLVQ